MRVNFTNGSVSSTARRMALLASALFIACYFLFYAHGSMRAEWTHDDLMNCWYGVSIPLKTLLGDTLLFFRFSHAARPFGDLVYRAGFDISGFDLRPLRLLLLVVLGLNIALTYFAVKRLCGSREAGLIAALLSSYHGNNAWFFYNTGLIYDIFCCFFYLSALVYYLRVRQAGRPLGVWQLLAFCGLYALALDSKELAVSLPVVLAAYELLYHPPKPRLSEIPRWCFRDFLPVPVTALMTAAYIAFRVLAPQGIGQWDGYKMTLSVKQYFVGTGHYLDELFYSKDHFGWEQTLLVMLALLAGAALGRSRKLFLCWLLFFAGVLPMVFIYPRGLTAVSIPIVGLFGYAAVVLVSARDAVLRLVRRTSWQPAGQVALFLLAAMFMIRVHRNSEFVYRSWQGDYGSIRAARESFSRLLPSAPKGTRMLIVNDPLNGTYSTFFLVRLLYRDSTLVVDQLFRLDPKPTAAELAKYDYIFSQENGKLVRLDPAEYAKRSARK